MSKRTQIVCIHEGKEGISIDPVFVNAFIKAYDPVWIRPWGTSKVRLVPYGGKTELRKGFAKELKNTISAGAETTLMVLTDIDDEFISGDKIKKQYWETAQKEGVSKEDFDKAVFICPKDRLENWIEFVLTGKTNEDIEGVRIHNNPVVRDAAKKLANMCLSGKTDAPFPKSLKWSCFNWHILVSKMK